MWLAFPHVRWYVSKDLVPILHEIDRFHLTDITPNEAPDSFLVSHDIERKKSEPRSFYVLADEGAIFFDARNYSKNFADESMTAMLVTPAHLNMQITVVVQDLDLLDKRFKDLCNEIVEFRSTWFGFARTGESLDKKQMLDRNYHGEIEVIEKKTYWMYFQHKRDTSEFFGGLYFTKELLGPRAIRRANDVTSIAQYIAQEDTLRDWREPYFAKLGQNLLKKGEEVVEKVSRTRFSARPLASSLSTKASENERERSGSE